MAALSTTSRQPARLPLAVLCLLARCSSSGALQHQHHTRRQWVGSAAAAALTPLAVGRARAADAPGAPVAAAALDLRAAVERAASDSLAGGAPRDRSAYVRPSYPRETDDIYYPTWLEGEWNVESKQAGLVAPVGAELFGPKGAYERARAALDEPALVYRARFSRAPDPPAGAAAAACTCERPFTVASISRAAMGSDAVLSVGGGGSSQPDGRLPEGATSADVLEVRLRPSGAGGRVFRVQLQVVGRSSRATSATAFECAELTRQTVFTEQTASAAGQPGAPKPNPSAPPSVKEIETTSVYDLQPSGTVLSRQRTATFLVADAAYTLPSSDLATLGRARAAGRYAVDVRTYELVYSRPS